MTMTPRIGRRVHLSLMAVWVLVGLPVSYELRRSIAWLVFLSVYAIIVGHWSGWSAERPTEIAGEAGRVLLVEALVLALCVAVFCLVLVWVGLL